MSNIFLAADHHFGHKNILNFTKQDGSRLRGFDSVEEMDEHLVQRHNSVVRPKDKIGDLAMSTNATGLEILFRLNGEKVLIKGNHDLAKLSVYATHFKDVRPSHQLDGLILTHIPIHPESLSRWRANVHGHLHSNRVVNVKGIPDPKYFCVSVEQLDNYTPISPDALNKKISI